MRRRAIAVCTTPRDSVLWRTALVAVRPPVMARSWRPWHPSCVHPFPRSFFLRAALGAAVLASVAAPAAGSQDRGTPAASPSPATDRVADREGRLRNLPTSLLVTLGPGVGPGAADAMAASRGLVRVAWNPDLRTAQYVAADLTTRRHRGPGGPGIGCGH